VEVEHHSRAGGARGGEPARADQRLHVVRVSDVGAELADRARDVLPGATAAQQGGRGVDPSRPARVALEQPVLDSGVRQSASLKLDGALLPALEAVAVVEQEDAGVARCAHQAGLRYRPRWTRPWCQSWSPRAAARRTSR
jgi:hypothetical protein